MTEKLIMHGNTNSLGAGQAPVNFNLNSPQSESGLPAPGPHINPNQQVMKKKNTLVSKLTKAALLLAAVVAPLTTAKAQLTQIFPVTQVWKYDPACHEGDNWQTTAYDDSGWLSGPGGFTGGENNAAIVPILNTTTLPAPATQSPAGHAMYFRTHFNLASIANVSLTMSNAIDDGATFYLNGTQILNLRVTTPGTCASFSGGAIGAGTDALLWEVHTFTTADLAGIAVAGDNVLAVEVHQVNATSSDMVFGMVLMNGTVVVPPPQPPIAFTNGTGVITFDTAPPAQQWSTITGTGGHGDFDGTADAVLAALDVAAKTNDASIITTALTSLTGNPPTSQNTAVYASDAGAQYLQTCPTGNAYTRLMATLTNLTGSAINSLGIRYDLTVRSVVVEQLAGHIVYYSTSGTPGSWVQIPLLNDQTTDDVAGTYHKTADITLTTPWAANSKMYFLWCDDNANPASPDTRYGIDNVQFVTLTPVCPAFANNPDPTDRTIVQCSSTTLTAGAAIGFPNPTYQWYRTNSSHPIAGATSPSYTIANAQVADGGPYFVIASNAMTCTATSHIATVTVTPAPTFAAVKAVSSTNQTDILISFNLPVDSATIDPNGFDIDVHERGGGGSVGVSSAAVVNGTNVLVVAGGPMTVGVSYDVEFQNAGAGNTCTGAKVIGNVHVTASVVILLIDDQQMWRYNDSGNAPAAQGALQWTDVGWDDSAWLQGLAVFDAKRNQDRRTNTTPFIGISNTPVRTMLTLSNATADLTTYNFRTHFGNFPYGVPNRLQAVSFFDDGGAVWVNGTLGFRNRDDATNVFAAYSGNPYAINPASDAIYEGLFDLPAIALTTANNVVAVELKQADATSSDATMGLILIGLYDSFAPRLNAATDRNFQQTDLTWSSGTLQYNTNLSRGSGWHDVPGAVSPYTVFWSPGLGAGHAGGTNTLFYRLR